MQSEWRPQSTEWRLLGLWCVGSSEVIRGHQRSSDVISTEWRLLGLGRVGSRCV